MRFLKIIFVAYLLFLTVKPCIDEHVIIHADNIQITNTCEHGEENNHNEKDLCAPLCSCDCCSITSLSVEPFILNNSLPSVLSKFDHLQISSEQKTFLFSPPPKS